MSTKLTNMICYRLDSELKEKLLDKLDQENISLSNFHRHIVQASLVVTERTANTFEPIERGSLC